MSALYGPAKTTDEYLSEMGYSLFDEYARAVEWAAILAGASVFDAATGPGRMTRVLLERDCQVISGDIDRQRLDALKSSPPFSGNPRLHLIHMNLDSLGFRDQCFDHIVCANALHELKHPNAVLYELLRVYTGRGKLVLIDFTEQGFSVIEEIIRLRHGKGHSIHGTMSREATNIFLKDHLIDLEEIDLPLNWVQMASGKR